MVGLYMRFVLGEPVLVEICWKCSQNWQLSKTVKNALFLSAFSHHCSLRLIVGFFFMLVPSWRSIPSFRSEFDAVGVKLGKFLSSTMLFKLKMTSQLVHFLLFSTSTGFREAPFSVRFAPISRFLWSDRFPIRYCLIVVSFLVRSIKNNEQQ